MSLMKWTLPYFGYTDECHLLLSFLCKETNKIYKDEEAVIQGAMLKFNKREIMLTDSIEHLAHHTLVKLIRLFQVSKSFN
jgi:hypothetical protein